ncbi:MAG: flagellar protein [candidate division Zixibacteria bacterium]|nr:flagellar protein [candidate division Zixibacteria bacterium]
MDELNLLNQINAGKVTPQTGQAEKQKTAEKADGLEFSKHLMERINRRKLQVGPEETRKLSEAMNKAEAKGSKDSLVLLNDLAFIVSVHNRTVVTAMDKNKMNEGVFTNIDSAIIM